MIGNNVKIARKGAKLTQQDLSKCIDVSRSYVSDIENGRYIPSAKLLNKISECTGLSIYFLTTGNKTIDDLVKLKEIDQLKSKVQELHEEDKQLQLDLIKVASEGVLSYNETSLVSSVIMYLRSSQDRHVTWLIAFFEYLRRYQESSFDDKQKYKQSYLKDLENEFFVFSQDFFDIVPKALEKEEYNKLRKEIGETVWGKHDD